MNDSIMKGAEFGKAALAAHRGEVVLNASAAYRSGGSEVKLAGFLVAVQLQENA
jgi:hypothetical protein